MFRRTDFKLVSLTFFLKLFAAIKEIQFLKYADAVFAKLIVVEFVLSFFTPGLLNVCLENGFEYLTAFRAEINLKCHIPVNQFTKGTIVCAILLQNSN